MSSPIYQYMINLNVSLPFSGGPGVLANVSVREHRAFKQLDCFMWQRLLYKHHYH